ncbi:MAG: hypothetical protein K2N49_07520 [Ruminococcus sp.]|nr:hypothetical protein [Ruminococcus sp.]MDE7226679.1 hypothetical protein [Ruminococcus sp.]
MSNILKSGKRFCLTSASIIIISALIYLLLWIFFPIVLSDKSVKNHIMWKIPVGTNWEDTVEIIDKNKWTIEITDIEHGLRINDSAGSAGFADTDTMLNGSECAKCRIVGKKAIFIELGEFYSPFHTAVFAYLAFDENGSLIETAIRRDIDGI